MILRLQYKEYGSGPMGYPYSEDETFWEKECSRSNLEEVKRELYDYVRKEFSIDWFEDSLEEKSEKSYTLNHLRCQVVFMGNVIDSWDLPREEFIFNRELVEIL